MEVIIQKGGKLTSKKWDGDLQNYVFSDVTDRAAMFLYKCCTLETGVTLRDIFLLLATDLPTFDIVINNWCSEYVAEGLAKSEFDDWKPEELEIPWDCLPLDPDADGKIEYLQLSWALAEEADNVLAGFHFPDFNGVGPLPKEKDGTQRTGTWAVEGCSCRGIIDLEVRLNPIITISDACAYSKEPRTYSEAEFNLGHILYGIIWELSYFGPPAKRDAFMEELRNSIAENE